MAREKDFNMECYPYDFKRFATWKYGIIQPKYDGDRVRMVIRNKQAILLSSSKRLITSLPHLNKEFTERYSKLEGFELDFEAYYHGMKHPEISGIIRTTKFVPAKAYLIKAYILDIPQAPAMLEQRISLLNEIKESSLVISVPSYRVNTCEEIQNFLKTFCADGYEGFVLKNPMSIYETKRSVNWIKYKPRKSDSYPIVGFEEEVDKYGQRKGTLGALILASPKGTFSVGTGFNQHDRDEIWNNQDSYLGKLFTISYQELSKDGIPREPSTKITKDFL